MGVRKRTIDRAPTRPSDRAREDFTTVMMIIVVRPSVTNVAANRRRFESELAQAQATVATRTQVRITPASGVTIEKIDREGVWLALENGSSRLVKAETVILVGHPEADTSLLDRLKDLAPEVHAIGDATGFGLSKKAATEALRAAYAIG